ncbi:DUF6443 domain-containing protein, partial [Taibaiella helva]|uniref:DUF6443 domain-containing protein n=1 Tax=Taibaiella helva TaxID=2301235 RepID=UPI0013002E0F
MQPFLHTIIKALVLCLLLLGSWPQATIFAQTNKPQLNQQAPAGSVTNTVPVPPAININSSELYNFERSFVPRVPIDDPATLTTTSAPSDVQVSTLYKDGFSRGMQAVAHNFTQGKSLVSPVDTRFRPQETGYLPYSSAGYGFRANAFTEQQAYYSNLYPNEGNTAYSLQRNTSAGNVLRMTSYAPGKSQVGQSRGTETLPITEACSCIRRWSVDGNGKPLSNGVYAAGELLGSLVQSPASGTALPPRKFVYKNKDGRVVLEQIADSLTPGPDYTYQLTFYIYNPQGQLCYVVPPAAADNALSAGSISQATLDQYCFQYRYDSKGRKVEQKVPGKGWEYFVYDKRDRLVLYQDSSLKSAGGWWSFTLYDALDRPTVTGKGQAIGTTRQQFAALMEDGSTYPSTHVLYYAKNYNLYHVYPAALDYCEIWSYFYYDDYREADPNGDLWNTYSTELQFSEQQSLPGSETPQRSNRTQGLPTGSLVKILPAPGASGTGAWRRTALFYDDKGRLIYSAGQDLATPGSTNIVHASYAGSQYTFTGQVLNTKHVLVNNKSSDGYLEHSEATRNEYEAATGRLSKTWRKVDNAGGWTLTSSLYYDELGRLQRKVFTNGGETQDYSYNIRGQLTGINGVYAETGNREFQYRSFGESLKYDYGFDKPRFDGKIAGMIWRGSNGANLGNNISSMHAYGYDYDLSGRLKLADYYLQQEYNGQGQVDPWSKTLLDFTVSNLYYDKNGNI